MKFFRKNFADIDYDGVLIEASTGVSLRNVVRDRRRYGKWESVGSSDATTEYLIVYFDEAKTIDRLILVGHNFKAFTAQYYDGSAWQDFSSVVTKEGSHATISETDNEKTTSYYEFSSVSAERVKVTITATQTADAEKSLRELIVTEEIGTFEGWPTFEPSFDYNQIEKKSGRGRSKYTLFDESFSCRLVFKGYQKEDDHALVQTLWQGMKEFLIYPCGGDASQFNFQEMGNRLEDIFLVWFTESLSPTYTMGVYSLGLNYDVRLGEVV